MADMTLVAELFPKGVVIRLRKGSEKRYAAHWQFQGKPYSLESDELRVLIHDTLQAISAQEGGVV